MRMFADWIEIPENHAATLAVHRFLRTPSSRFPSALSPLFLHGPTGTGKTHLIAALSHAWTAACPKDAVQILAARDLPPNLQELTDAALFVIEDLQHLRASAAGTLAEICERRSRRGLATVVTATRGPGHLQHLPARLTSRLASGLVIGLSPLGAASRQIILRRLAQKHGINLSNEILEWIADHHGASARELQGSLQRLAALTRIKNQPLDLKVVQASFQESKKEQRLTIDSITQRVGKHFRIDHGMLKAPDRSRHVLLPRQVGMYLARQLTRLSLNQIGAHFGGRDHATVLHACRKVEKALTHDASLSGVVRELQAVLR